VYVDPNGQLIMRNSAKICDNTVGGNGYGLGAGVYVGADVNNYKRGYFRLEGGTISGNKGVGMASYSFYYNGNDYTVYYYDYSRGGGVFVDDGHFEMSGGLITGNTIEEPEIVLTEQQQQEQEQQQSNNDNQQQQQQQQQHQMSKEDAERMLKALENQEKETMEEMNEKKASQMQKRKSQKDW
ncbi:MAG: hypothetical protein IKU01_04895, partial [Bacteroidales bacterium]|nr:hypothetical protein [Bacteroidales bacterium]